MKRKGFTLIELLVVIAIIALLMAILLPTLEKVRQQTQKVICVSNLKQWGTIIYMYLEDSGWNLPTKVGGDNNWLGVTTPYIQNDEIRLCPRATQTIIEGARQPFAANDSQRPPYKGSYGFHDWFTADAPDVTDPNPKKWQTPNIKRPERVPIYAGCVRLYLVNPNHGNDPPEYEGDVLFGSGPAGGEGKNYMVNRHNGYSCATFLDFSARPIGLKEYYELNWHRDWNPNYDPPPPWPEWMKGFKEYYRY